MPKYLIKTLSASRCTRQRRFEYGSYQQETLPGFGRTSLFFGFVVFSVLAGYLYSVNETSVQGSRVNALESEISLLETEIRELEIAGAQSYVYSHVLDAVDSHAYHPVQEPRYLYEDDRVAFETSL